MTQQSLPGIPAPQEQDPVEVERERIVNEWLMTLSKGRDLTAVQRREVLNIAKGLRAKDVALAEGNSPETIRARRKRLYNLLGADDAIDVVQRLLAHALAKLGRAA